MYQEFELGRGADILVRELFKLAPDETFLITADTESDFRIVAATARVAYAVGARPLVVWTATPKASGKAGEATWPVGALTAVLKEADAWAEFNRMAIFYSTPYDIAFAENRKLRHLCLVGMHSAMLSRCIAGTNFKLLGGFLEKVAQLTHEAKHVRIATPAGGDVEFDNKPEWPINTETGYADRPGSHMIPGQIGWAPDFDTVNGTIVFDGSVSKVPGLGILNQPIRLRVQKATIAAIEGGREASMFESWLRSWNHPQMLRLAHVCYGFLPNAVLTGIIAEDERIWGSTQWGIGNVGPTAMPPVGMPAPSHMDGICLNSSVWLDGEPITADGKVVHPKLLSLAKELGK